MLSKAKQQLLAAVAFVAAMAPDVQGLEPGQTDRAQMGGMDLPGVMIVLVIAGVVGFIGLQVMSTTIDTTSLQSGDPLYNASTALQTSVNNAWSLVGVAFIVVILAVIIVYLYGVRGGR